MEKETLHDTTTLRSPDAAFSIDIDNRVLQAIAVQCIAKIEGISLLEGNLLDQLLGRDQEERATGIHIEHDSKQQSINVKVEVKVAYGANIPQKAEELQSKIAAEIGRYTGLQVGGVHVVFRNLVHAKKPAELTATEQDAALQDPPFESLPEIGSDESSS